MVGKRYFIGLEVPPSCAETLVALDPGLDEVEWVPAEQLHLPLSLSWTLDAQQEERLRESLATVKVQPFFLPLTGLSSFGKAPSISISVGVGKGHPHFFALHRFVQDAVIKAQLEPDLRPFHPHIKVATAREAPQGKFLRFLRENAEAEFCLLHVDGLALFSRGGSGHGAPLAVEMHWPF